MSQQPSWNKYEVALLIDAYQKVKNDSFNRVKVLQKLSDDLRTMAINSGIVIDETYRNMNGMQWQFSIIKHTFMKTGWSSHMPPKLFQEMVELYETDEDEFKKTLMKAYEMVDSNTENTMEEIKPMFDIKKREEVFSSWLSTQPKLKASVKTIISVYKECSEYTTSHNISKNSFWNIDDPNEYSLVVQKLMGMKLFRVTHRKSALLFDKIFPYYKVFLAEKKDSKPIARQDDKDENKTEELTSPCSGYQREVSLIIKAHYPYGYRLESSIEMKRFRRFAESDGVNLPESDEQLKEEISNAGFVIDGKVFVITENVIDFLKTTVHKLVNDGFSVLFYEAIMNLHESAMEENHITSCEMLKEIVIHKHDVIFADYSDVFLAKNFVSLIGKRTENEAVTQEICQTWDAFPLRTVDEICKSLPTIPEEYIRRYLSANRNFVWDSEEKYLYLDRFVICEEEKNSILTFVEESCNNYGFASISEAPLESVSEENYELSQIGLFNAVYNKLLFDGYYINGRIITREKSDLNAVELAKRYIGDRDECSFTEVNDKIVELTGATNYRYMAYEALYDKMIRISENRYVSERQVMFDVDAIDSALKGFISNRFSAIKEITSFALFPICGQVWNHYLLESYCNRYSKKYSLRVTGYNDKNVGIIAEKNVTENYEDLLAIAAARSNRELTPESIGQFFVDAGYMGKRKFKALENVIEKATTIREEQ